MAGRGPMVYSRADCLSIARTCLRTARHYLPGGIWESWGEEACARGLAAELASALAWRELARRSDRESGGRDSDAQLLPAPPRAPRKVAKAKEAKRRELELDLGDFPANRPHVVLPMPDGTGNTVGDQLLREIAERRAAREARWAAIMAQPPAPPPPELPPIGPGDAVIMAVSGSSGWADSLPRRPWVVVSCDCAHCTAGTHLALDVERSPELLAMYPEMPRWVHVGRGAVRRRGEVSRRLVDEWVDLWGVQAGQAAAWAVEGGVAHAQGSTEALAWLSLLDAGGGDVGRG